MEKSDKIDWYRTVLDKQQLSELTKRSDVKGFLRVIPQLLFSVLTGYFAYFCITHGPLWIAIAACYMHATFFHFMGLAGVGHELSHNTVFNTRYLNELFTKIFSFLTWNNIYFFRESHVRHHQFTVHHELDMEVILPIKIRKRDWVYALTLNIPKWIYVFHGTFRQSLGKIEGQWAEIILPESKVKERKKIIRWARTLIIGHSLFAAVFIYFNLWSLLLLVTFASFYAEWLNFLCGGTQHVGLQPDVSDFRLCCRTVKLNPVLRFFYYNMNFHLEHHMYAAVPCYNLPRLHRAIRYDLPTARPGLWAAWKEILAALKRQTKEPDYVLVPQLPGHR